MGIDFKGINFKNINKEYLGNLLKAGELGIIGKFSVNQRMVPEIVEEQQYYEPLYCSFQGYTGTRTYFFELIDNITGEIIEDYKSVNLPSTVDIVDLIRNTSGGSDVQVEIISEMTWGSKEINCEILRKIELYNNKSNGRG